MAADFISQTVGANHPLFRLIYRFNCQPAATIHAGRVNGQIDAGLFERLRGSNRAERRLSDWIIRQFELDPRGHWDFAEPRLRLALLDGAQLAQLTLLAGAAALHRHIARIIGGSQLRQVRESLGPEVHQFAVKRAGFLVRNMPDGLEPASLADDAARQATDLGHAVLARCLAGAPPAIAQRLALKLPPNRELRVPPSSPSADAAGTFRLAQRILAFEVAPELAPCFN